MQICKFQMTIGCDPKTVWGLETEPTRWCTWKNNVSTCVVKGGAAFTKGQSLLFMPVGQTTPIEMRITSVVPFESFNCQAPVAYGTLRITHSITHGTDSCLLTHLIEFEPNNVNNCEIYQNSSLIMGLVEDAAQNMQVIGHKSKRIK